jgi:phage-related protein
MSLLCIGRRRWSVLVTEQVLEELADWGTAKEPKTAMVSLLTKTVPDHGPPFGTPACTPMGDGLFEFRKGEHRGPKFRVLWFYGDASRTQIVCVRGFVKTSQKTPPQELEAARQARDAYERAGSEIVIEEGSDLVRRKR